MDLQTTSNIYIISQVSTVLGYAVLSWSYFLKTKNRILLAAIVANVLIGVAFILLGGWSGLAMCVIAVTVDSLRLLGDVKIPKLSKIMSSTPAFIATLAAIVGCAVFTYEGVFSLMSILATALFRFSAWQKSTWIYKLCGVPVGILWVIYNVYLGSLFGWILESALLLFVIIGIVMERRRAHQQAKNDY